MSNNEKFLIQYKVSGFSKSYENSVTEFYPRNARMVPLWKFINVISFINRIKSYVYIYMIYIHICYLYNILNIC